MASRRRPRSSLYRLRRQVVVVVVAVVLVMFAAIGGAWDAAAGRRLDRWEHDLQPMDDDCPVGATTRQKFELQSTRPDSAVQLLIRCNLPVSNRHDTRGAT